MPDLLMIQGRHPLITHVPFSPGIEVAGTVSAVGEGVDFAVGERVMARTDYRLGWGGYAEYCLADAGETVRTPRSVTDIESAGLYCSYRTAHVAFRRGELKPGETVLVLGASGISGGAAIQLAKVYGARVIAVSSSDEKLQLCKEAGADELIDHTLVDMQERVMQLTDGKGVDIIFDPVGGDLGTKALKTIGRYGRLLPVGYAAGSWPSIDLTELLLRNYSVVGVFSAQLTPEERTKAQSDLMELAEKRRITVQVGKVFPFQALPDALETLANGSVVGRIFLEV